MSIPFKMRPLGLRPGLPVGFTELEYLESSGTQYIDTGIYLSNRHNVALTMQQVQSSASSGAVFGSQDAGNATDYAWSIYGSSVTYFGWFFYKTLSTAVDPGLVPSYTRFDVLQLEVVDGRVKINGLQLRLPTADGAFTAGRTCWIFARNTASTPLKFVGKIFSFEITGAESMKLIPALRVADGVPGMWDSVSKRFFENAGAGVFGYRVKGAPAAFSLRDPHRVAPSGVYARKAGENELEIVADTELADGEELGYTWYANVGDAYECFGVVPEGDEILTE